MTILEGYTGYIKKKFGFRSGITIILARLLKYFMQALSIFVSSIQFDSIMFSTTQAKIIFLLQLSTTNLLFSISPQTFIPLHYGINNS